MGTVATKGNTAWRDYETDGVPATGEHRPLKNEIRDFVAAVDAVGVGAGMGLLTFPTLAAMNAYTTAPANTTAQCLQDNNMYRWVSPTWTLIGPSPAAGLSTAQADIDDLQSRVGTIEPIVATHTTEIAALTTQVDANTALLANHEEAITEIWTETDNTADSLQPILDANLDARVTVLEEVNSDVRLDSLESINAGPRLDALEDETGDDHRLDQVEHAVIALGQHVSTLDTQVQAGKDDDLFDPAISEIAVQWSSVVTGDPLNRPSIAASEFYVSSHNGTMIRIQGAAVRAPRAAYRLLNGHKYEILGAVRRANDPTDPLGDSVALRMAWLSSAKAQIAQQTLMTGSLTVSMGLQIYRVIVSLAAGDEVDIVAPASTVYMTPFMQTWGSDGTTDIMPYLRVTDLTSNTLISADTAGMNARISALEDIDAETRLTALEAAVDSNNLVNVLTYQGLEAGGDFSPALQAAMDFAVANGFEGVYFPPRETPYLLNDCDVPPNCKIFGHPQATLSPFGYAYTVFNLTGDNIEFAHLNCVGVGNFEQRHLDGTRGVGAIVYCQLEIVTPGSPPILGLQANADSTYDDLTIADWQPSTPYLGLDVNGDPQSLAKLQPSKTIWSALISHTSDPNSMINDIIAGIWIGTNYGLTLSGGGSNYRATDTEDPGDDPEGVGGPYFDYLVTEANSTTGIPGTGGKLRCYTDAAEGVSGSIIRVRVTAQGSGYRSNSLTDPNRIMRVGNAYPTTRWINGQNVDTVTFPPPINQDIRPFKNLILRDSSFLYGQLPLQAIYCTHLKVLRNYMGYLQGGGVNLIDCDDYTIQDNFIEECWGSQSNGIHVGSYSGDLRPRGVYRGVIAHNRVRRCIGGDGVGIHANSAMIASLVIDGNIMELCETGSTLKHGWNSNTYTPGTFDEFDVGYHGITYTGNVIRVDTGHRGVCFHNNMRDNYQFVVDDSNIIESIGGKVGLNGAVTTAMTVINCMNSVFRPVILGRFYVSIWVDGAYHCTFDPVTDGRSNVSIDVSYGRARPCHLCRFPGEYLANNVALQIYSATKPIFNGTRALVRGRPINSITIVNPGSGGPHNAVIPVYLHGGGNGLQVQCTVVNGVITKASYVASAQEMMFGVDYFDGGNGTVYIKVKQNGGSGAIIKVPMRMGQGLDPISTYFTASISGTNLVVSAITPYSVSAGVTTQTELEIGQYINGDGVAQGQVIQEQLSGPPGGIGTYRVKIPQTLASTPMKALLPFATQNEVVLDLVDASHAVVASAGSGYLNGGNTTADLPLLVEMGQDFVGTVTTDGIGAVISTTIIDAGGHFRDVPDFTFESGITWGSIPVLTAVLPTGNVQGLQLRNIYGGQIANSYFEGGINGAWLYGETVQGLDILSSEFKSDIGEPLLIDGTDHLGVMRGITLIYGDGVARTAVTVPQSGTAAFKSWSRGEDNLIQSTAVIKNIHGMTSSTTYRVAGSGSLTFDNRSIPATSKALTASVAAPAIPTLTADVMAPISRVGTQDHAIGAIVLHLNDVTNIAIGMWIAGTIFPGVPNGQRVGSIDAGLKTVTITASSPYVPGLVGPIPSGSTFYFHTARIPVSSTAGIVVGQRVTSAIAGLRIPTKVLAVGGALPAGVVELDGPLLYTMPSGTTVTFSNTTLTVASVTGVSAGQLASCAGLPTAIPSTTTVESVNIGANTITLNNGIAAAMPSTTVVAFAAISSNLYLKGQDTVVLNSTDDYATFLWNSTLGRAEFVGSNNDAFTSLNIDQGVTTDYNPILFATSTWNNASTIFFGIELDIIDQASDPTSRLMGFYVGPDEPGLTEVFAVHKNGSVSVGAGGSISVGIDVRKDITGAASAYGVFVRGEIQPDVTNLASCFTTQPTVAPGATFTSFTHFYAFQGLISQDANVQNQYGVLVAANLIDASVLNVGLSSALPIGSPGAVTVNITAMSYSGGTVTATTASPHGVLVGQLFRVDGSVAATIPAGYNGNHVATAGTTGSTLKWAAAADPGAIVGGAYGQSKAVGTYNLYCPGTAFNLVFGPFGVGSANLSGYSFRSNLDMTGGGTVFTRAIAASGTIQSDITGTAAYFEAALGTAAAAFTVGSIYAYQAYIRVGGIGAGSSITNLFGFYANSTMAPVSGVTNSYAFYGQYPVQANTYNLYMAGTAFNYLGGPLGLGTTVLTGYAFRNTLAGANSFTGDLTIYAATVVPAGGSIGVGYKISSTTNLGWFVGSGPPTLSAAKGSVYSNTTAITTTSRVYVNIDGGTTWANFTASA